MSKVKSICRSCFHSYVCEQFNEHRDIDNKHCHFYNDHFVPTADMVEVVRCKDCRIATEDIMIDGWFYCNNNNQTHKPDHFCSYGERKETECR